MKKKFRHVKEDIVETIRNLERYPGIGEPIPGWNKEIWKIRVASSDIKKGKRGAFRLIYCWKDEEYIVYMLSVYFKGTQENITSKEIQALLIKLTQELESE